MKIKHWLFIIFCVISLCSITITSAAQPKTFQNFSLSNNQTALISTAGPITHHITNIQLLNGSSDEITQINRILDSRMLQLVLPVAVISVEHLTFTITYKLNGLLPNGKFSYYTAVTDYMNGTISNSTSIINKKHTIHVENFGGVFLFTRATPFRPINHQAAKFQIIGACEKITILS
ncbi:MAG: hypothetical protein NT038_00205 [Euryarchaeota archaeon]|nr:hypothetical protein [Euryarchaeota archaeon]